MKRLISNTVRVLALVAATSITSLTFYVHAVDREYLVVPAAVATQARA